MDKIQISLIKNIPLEFYNIYKIIFNNKTNNLIFYSQGEEIEFKIFDLINKVEIIPNKEPYQSLLESGFFIYNDKCIICSSHYNLHVLNLETLKFSNITHHNKEFYEIILCYTKDCNYFLTQLYNLTDSTFCYRVFETKSLTAVDTFGHNFRSYFLNDTHSIYFTENNYFSISNSENIIIYDIKNKLTKEINLPGNIVKFLPNEKKILICNTMDNDFVKIYDFENNKIEKIISAYDLWNYDHNDDLPRIKKQLSEMKKNPSINKKEIEVFEDNYINFPFLKKGEIIKHIEISPDKRFLFLKHSITNANILIIDINTLEVIKEFEDVSYFGDFGYSSDGKYFTYQGSGTSLLVYELEFL